jgi:hypothetical protein
MSGNTGLLTARCDVYGAESNIQLFGGYFPESMNGKHHWYCENNSVGRFRMTCTGGDYGVAVANDGGLRRPYHCEGGHRGQVMPLCGEHRVEVQRRQSGCCPACAVARHDSRVVSVMGEIESAQASLAIAQSRFDWLGELRYQQVIESLAHRMTEFNEQGITHKCPLILREVS